MIKHKIEKILKQVQNDKSVETGRSMTEMLGVLAVVGVLSIGGIAGYTYAMDKHHANEIINSVSMMALTAAQQHLLEGTINFNEYGNQIAGYEFVADTEYDKGAFTIEISGVPEGVCEQIKAMNWTAPSDIWINDSDENECVDEDNTITFVFDNELEDNGCGFGKYPDEDGCAECPTTFSSIKDKMTCISCGGTWDGSACVGETACADGAFRTTAGCISCSNSSAYYATMEECLKCADSDMPRFMGTNNSCYPCSRETKVSTTEEGRAMCDGSDYPRYFNNNGESYGCYIPSNTIYVVTTTAEECARCDGTKDPRFLTSEGKCYPCADASGYKTDSEQCYKCANTDTPRFMSDSGVCYICHRSDPYSPTFSSMTSTSEEECLRCAGTNRFYMDGKCILDCRTEDKPYMNSNGTCYDCNSVNPGSLPLIGDCSICDGNTNNPLIQSTNGYCNPCSTSGGFLFSKEECSKCDGSEYPRFMSGSNYCYNCSYSDPIATSSEECAKCEGSNSPRVYIDGKCYPDCRTDEKPIMNSSGTCYACDATTAIATDAENCSACDRTDTPRVMENGKCVLKNCPSGDGEVYVKNKTGGCSKCSATGISYSDAGHLEVCKAAGYPRFTNPAGTTSYICTRTKISSSNADVCHLCNYAGSPAPRFIGTDNYCYPCSESTSVATSAEECAVCGGSRTYDSSTGKCSLAS